LYSKNLNLFKLKLLTAKVSIWL